MAGRAEIKVADADRRPFFTARSLAEYLSVSTKTIRNWTRAGRLPHYRFGDAVRYDPADLDSFVASHRDERTAA